MKDKTQPLAPLFFTRWCLERSNHGQKLIDPLIQDALPDEIDKRTKALLEREGKLLTVLHNTGVLEKARHTCGDEKYTQTLCKLSSAYAAHFRDAKQHIDYMTTICNTLAGEGREPETT